MAYDPFELIKKGMMDHILAHSSEPVPSPEARGTESKKSNDDDDEDEEAQISIGASSLENEAKVRPNIHCLAS